MISDPLDITSDLLATADLPDDGTEAAAAGPDGDGLGLDSLDLGPDRNTDNVLSTLDLDGDGRSARPLDAALSTRDLLMHALAESGGDDDPAPTPRRQRGTDLNDAPYVFLPDADDARERRSSMRFPLALPAELVTRDRRTAPAAVTSGSIDALFIQTQHPPEVDTSLEVELEMLGNHGRRCRAVVVRTTRRGFAIQLEPDPKAIGFRAAFIELARQASLQAPRIRIEIANRPAEVSGDPAGPPVDDLESAWSRVLDRPEDDEVNQSFIHACMRLRNLEFAFERYTERVTEGDQTAERYLEQVGTILGFYNMQRDDIPLGADGVLAGGSRGWVALALALLMALGVAGWAIQRYSGPEVTKPKGPRGPGLIHVNWELGD